MPAKKRKGISQAQLLDELSDYDAVQISVAITADATAGLSVPLPKFAFEVLDVTVQCRATNASGTVTLRKSTTAISDAIVMATTKAITRAGTLDTAQSVIQPSDSINLKTNGAADRGLVTIWGRRV